MVDNFRNKLADTRLSLMFSVFSDSKATIIRHITNLKELYDEAVKDNNKQVEFNEAFADIMKKVDSRGYYLIHRLAELEECDESYKAMEDLLTMLNNIEVKRDKKGHVNINIQTGYLDSTNNEITIVNDKTALHIAAEKGNTGIYALLHDKISADNTIKNKEGKTPKELILPDKKDSFNFFKF